VAYGLALSAGATLYVAATDLLPEVNREPGILMPLWVFVGVAVMLALRWLAPV
jgi:ZIP family zinc transporter/zinc and cadmium transporter